MYSNLVLLHTHKPPDHVMDNNDSKTYGMKIRMDIWTSMDVVPVEYGIFAQKFHLNMWFFQFITGITFKWDYVIWRIIYLII